MTHNTPHTTQDAIETAFEKVESTHNTQHVEHIRALIDKGYTIQDIAEVTNHSVEWVLKHIREV